MSTTGRFRVESRLIEILGAQYRSSEDAVKELVANAWDADATVVEIHLPEPLTTDPIVVRDNGYGMTPREIEGEYLCVAYDRRRAKGDKTPKGRVTRGFRGIGKFGGLMAAEAMTVTSISRGTRSRFSLNRDQLAVHETDLEALEIEIETQSDSSPGGTVIELSGLRQTFAFPDSAKLARLLLREFTRRDDFFMTINGDPVTADVLEGRHEGLSLGLRDGQAVTGSVWFLDKTKAVADPGIIVRVDGRAIGAPTFFGLEQDPDVPRSVLNRVYGEVNADHLRDDVTSGWDAFIENSHGYQALRDTLKGWLKEQVLGVRDVEAASTRDEFVSSFSQQLELLPLTKRDEARRALLRVFDRFYDHQAEDKRAIAELVLNAFEVDEYRTLVRRIDETPRDDIVRLADILRQWGISEIRAIVERADQRLRVVDAFESLIRAPSTPELSGVHRALEDHAWLLGDQYELLKSNRTLRNIVQDVLGARYQGARGAERPDLFLVGLQDRFLLVELKRPGESLNRYHAAQVKTYRDQLLKHVPSGHVEVVLVGGAVESGFRADEEPHLKVTTFREVVLGARARLQWLVQQLGPEVDEGSGSS